MQPEAIQLSLAENRCENCSTVIVVPDPAVAEPGRIKMFSGHTGSEIKHEFYTLSQIAFIQYTDGELDVERLKGPLRVTHADQVAEICAGLLICWMLSGSLALFACTEQPVKKLLEAAHRFCTRWIRLDI